jgi:hypothetical protein
VDPSLTPPGLEIIYPTSGVLNRCGGYIPTSIDCRLIGEQNWGFAVKHFFALRGALGVSFPFRQSLISRFALNFPDGGKEKETLVGIQ